MADQYPEIREEIAQIEDTLLDMAESLARTPPPGVWDKIMERVDTAATAPPARSPELPAATQQELKKKTKKIHYWQYGVAATFTLKLLFMAVAARFWYNWQSTENQLNGLRQQYQELQQQSQQATQALLAINDPAFFPVVLEGQDSLAGNRVLAYRNEETQDVYVNISQLPATRGGEVYQLWGRVGEQMVSLGTLDPASNPSLPQLKLLSGPENLTELMISLEPAGGSPSPTAEPLFRQRRRAQENL